MTVLNQIQQAASIGELASVVIHYLYEIGETEEAHGETYGQTAQRLGGNAVLEAAEARRLDMLAGSLGGSSWHMLSARDGSAVGRA